MTAPTMEEVARGLRAVLAKCSYISSRGIGARPLVPHLIDGIAPTLADYVLGLIRDERAACEKAARDADCGVHGGCPCTSSAVSAIRSRGAS